MLATPLPVVDRLDEVAGIGRHTAQVIIAEVGLDMGQFPTPSAAGVVGQAVTPHHPVPRHPPSRRYGTGNPYLKAALGEAATAAKTDTFLGERYRHLVRRIGKRKALVAVAAPSW